MVSLPFLPPIQLNTQSGHLCCSHPSIRRCHQPDHYRRKQPKLVNPFEKSFFQALVDSCQNWLFSLRLLAIWLVVSLIAWIRATRYPGQIHLVKPTWLVLVQIGRNRAAETHVRKPIRLDHIIHGGVVISFPLPDCTKYGSLN
jgi:hypothetical protein